MRMLLKVKLPLEPFKSAVKYGSIGKKMKFVYFTEQEGHRGAILAVNVDNPSQVPFYAEPWFLTFNAECEFRIAMTPEDLAKAGLEEAGKRWA